jgi:hypothetical protein
VQGYVLEIIISAAVPLIDEASKNNPEKYDFNPFPISHAHVTVKGLE